jgi:hypothetical protein
MARDVEKCLAVRRHDLLFDWNYLIFYNKNEFLVLLHNFCRNTLHKSEVTASSILVY